MHYMHPGLVLLLLAINNIAMFLFVILDNQEKNKSDDNLPK